MKKIRVAFIASTLEVGGAEHVIYDVVTGVSRDRFECEMIFLRDPGRVGRRILQTGVKGTHGLLKTKVDGTAVMKIAGVLKGFRPDILFSLDHHNAIRWGGIASSFAGRPKRVIASHSTGHADGGKSFTGLDQFFIQASDRVIALSESHRAYLRDIENVDAAKIVIIENGIDIERYESVPPDRVDAARSELGLEEGEKVVTMIASLRPEKSHETLLAAASALVATGDGIRVLVVGDGPRREALEKMTSERRLETTVRFLGQRDDIPELLALSDVVVLPSKPVVETLPLAVLEAMAAGVPVIASTVGSIPDIIKNGVNGRLIEPGDAIGLSEAIRSIIEYKQETVEIVANARATIRSKYTKDRMIKRYESLFEQLLS